MYLNGHLGGQNKNRRPHRHEWNIRKEKKKQNEPLETRLKKGFLVKKFALFEKFSLEVKGSK